MGAHRFISEIYTVKYVLLKVQKKKLYFVNLEANWYFSLSFASKQVAAHVKNYWQILNRSTYIHVVIVWWWWWKHENKLINIALLTVFVWCNCWETAKISLGTDPTVMMWVCRKLFEALGSFAKMDIFLTFSQETWKIIPVLLESAQEQIS